MDKKYVKLEWPEIQEYMTHPNYHEECYFDPSKDAWFIPVEWIDEIDEEDEEDWMIDGPSIGDLEDAMG